MFLMSWRQRLHGWGFVLRETAASFGRNRGFGKAAMLAYYSFFALFPFLLLLLFVLGRVLVASRGAADALERMAEQTFPLFAQTIMREVHALSAQRTWGLVSLGILVWAVTPMSAALRQTFRDIFKAERPLPFWVAKPLDVGVVLALAALMVAVVVSEVTFSVVRAEWPERLSFLLRWVDRVGPFAATMAFLLLLHLAFDPLRMAFVHRLAGSVVSAGLLAVISPVFTTVVRFNPNYGFAFGSLKAVFLLLVWVYYAFVVILIGVELAANLHRRDALMVRNLLRNGISGAKLPAHLARFLTEWSAGQLIFKEGDPGTELYYVVVGSVNLSRGGQLIRVMKPGEYFGEMAMLLDERRTATATAAEDGTQLLALSASSLRTALKENPDMVLLLLREMAERLKAADQMIAAV